MALVPFRGKDNWWMDPFSDLEKIQREMNRLFDFSLARFPMGENTLLGSQWAPAVDVHESKDNILIKADLPGLKKDEIGITIQDNHVILKGEKKQEQEVKEDNHYRSERFSGSFCRMIPLPTDVDADKVDAKYQDGVLTLTLAKKEESKPKQIKIDVK